MRRTSLATVLLLATATALASSCSGSDDARPTPSGSSSTPTPDQPSDPGPSSDGTEAAAGDTFAAAEPATMEIPMKELPGFEDVRFWEGTELSPGPRMVTGGLTVDGSRLAVLVFSREPVLSQRSSEAEMRSWLKNSNQVDGEAEVLDPVVVDGAELLHARGDNGVEIVDYFVQVADDGSTLGVLFALPMELSETEREERIAAVMASIEFE